MLVSGRAATFISERAEKARSVVLESITNPFKAELHPAWLVLVGFAYAGIGILFSLVLFPENASMVMVFFITAASIPFLYNTIKYEEDKDLSDLEERVLIKEHGKAVSAYFLLFVGVTLGLTAAYLFLPTATTQNIFSAQIHTYQNINSGMATTTGLSGVPFFARIFLNNLRVLGYCVLFSFLYGAGAVYILTWNASVIALAAGNAIRLKLSEAASGGGLAKIASYLMIPAQVLGLRYGIHGALEVIAYIIAGLAGGIISVAVIKHHWRSKKFEHVVIDAADLIILSIIILFLAGVWEAWITPVFY